MWPIRRIGRILRNAETVRIVPDGSPVANYAFDVTPARLVSGLIAERGVLQADAERWRGLFRSG